MRPVDHFREPVYGVNRCECRAAVSCPSRSPEKLFFESRIGRSGWLRYKAGYLMEYR